MVFIIIIQDLIIISLIGYEISKFKKMRDYKKNLDEYKNELDDYLAKTISLKYELDMFKTSVYYLFKLLRKKRKNKNMIKTYKDYADSLCYKVDKRKFLAEKQENRVCDLLKKLDV